MLLEDLGNHSDLPQVLENANQLCAKFIPAILHHRPGRAIAPDPLPKPSKTSSPITPNHDE